MVLLNRSKVQETSFLILGFLSLYNGKPLKLLQNAKTIKKSCIYRLNCIGGCAEEAGSLDGIIQRSRLFGEIIEWWKKDKI